ncbi:DUF2628 domain-containing protein [Clostridium sp. HCP1S3_B4]|uniref:DUF2628 domain-containing protein n=1 Tax=unclassified Clostridium TaxID=2614128 RepID=UPI001699FDC3|nr:DUF2628 domain-containing protein [Clostridiales bacterium]MDY2730001.1 DUF2628 domain-containing protein [Clostridium sp.]NLK24729.1 DUF2628 domain-containing protein [Clostridiales bacterium]
MKETIKCSREELEAFIGIEAKKTFFSKTLDRYMKNRTKPNWNFGAFFLGPFYLMYRKCYIPAIIISIAYFSLILLPINLSAILLLIIMIILGLLGTNLYLRFCEREINIYREYNYMKSEKDFNNLLSTKGGTSFLSATILYFVFALFMWIKIFTM